MPPEKEPQLTVDEVSLRPRVDRQAPDARRSITRAGQRRRRLERQGPTLMEMATQVKWQPPAGMGASDAIDQLNPEPWRGATRRGQRRRATTARSSAGSTSIWRGGSRRAKRSKRSSRSARPDKRAALVDRLLAGDEYPRHMADVLDVVLMERKGPVAEASRKSHRWFDYLQSSVATNRPWNEIVADLITARPSLPDQAGAAWFLYERKNNHQAMAEAVAPIAFGVSVACAQCHNHPLAHEIKQQQYWGLVAAFNRTGQRREHRAAALSEAAAGGFVSSRT